MCTHNRHVQCNRCTNTGQEPSNNMTNLSKKMTAVHVCACLQGLVFCENDLGCESSQPTCNRRNQAVTKLSVLCCGVGRLCCTALQVQVRNESNCIGDAVLASRASSLSHSMLTVLCVDMAGKVGHYWSYVLVTKRRRKPACFDRKLGVAKMYGPKSLLLV